MPNRVDTWQNRIESFSEKRDRGDYQVEKAKIAIATGGFWGVAQGKVYKKTFYHNHRQILFLQLL